MVKKLKKRKYGAANGCPYTNKDAQVIGEELERIRDIYGGEVSPQHVYDESRHKKAALYSYLEWDNEKCGDRWRLEQIKRMIRIVYVRIEDDGEPRETRAMVSVISHETGTKRYVSVERAMKDNDYRKQVIQEAMNKANTWRNKYREYKELGKIFQAIDEWE